VAARSQTAEERIGEAFALARNGELLHAEARCHAILESHPSHPNALLLRAVIELQTGRAGAAIASLGRLIAADDTRPAAHALLGDALLALERPVEALESYETALRRDPGLASAQYGRGGALLELGRMHEAVAEFDRVLARQPGDADAWYKRGNALFGGRQMAAAVESYDRALTLRPAHAAALNNRGGALLALRRLDTALDSFEAALAIDAAFLDAEQNRGTALRRLGRPAEALLSFDRVLAARPLSADALCGRGDALLDLHDPDAALAAHDAAVGLRPDSSDLQNSRGNSLRALGRLSEAIVCYDAALRSDPANAVIHHNRGTALLQAGSEPGEYIDSFRRVLELDPQFAYVAGTLFHLRQQRADWNGADPATCRERLENAALAGRPVVHPFHCLAVTDSAAAQLRCADAFVEHRYGARAARWVGRTYRHERIRVGYVSADFREHAVSYLMAGIFERHDRRRFETIAISLRPPERSAMGERVEHAFGRFFDVSTRSDADVAALLREMEIDIAVDLNGFTDGMRPGIFLARTAPIQVNYLGFPGTTGGAIADYVLADRVVIPPQARDQFGEKVVYLPGCFQAGDSPSIERGTAQEVAATRAALGISADSFVFACLNNTYKLNPAMFDVWMRLLACLPGSLLWLLGDDAAVRANLRREAGERDIDPSRLVFTPRVPYAQYLDRLKIADLFLDTLPFNGGTTASDALRAGVPLLTCMGEAFAARMAGSLLISSGLPELVADSLGDYEARALDLARRPEELSGLRRRLAGHETHRPLFDADRFTRHLEAAYELMWQRQQRGDPPEHFTVPAA